MPQLALWHCWVTMIIRMPFLSAMSIMKGSYTSIVLWLARMLGNRYNPNQDEALQKEIESGLSRMQAIRFDIEHLTGKEAIELVRQHQK